MDRTSLLSATMFPGEGAKIIVFVAQITDWINGTCEKAPLIVHAPSLKNIRVQAVALSLLLIPIALTAPYTITKRRFSVFSLRESLNYRMQDSQTPNLEYSLSQHSMSR